MIRTTHGLGTSYAEWNDCSELPFIPVLGQETEVRARRDAKPERTFRRGKNLEN